ncbi:MAG: hypothetical protein ACI4EV_06040 [Lachnospiraceae bacterium]
MAKKFFKAAIGVAAAAVAGKVVYDKYKVVKNQYEKEEEESAYEEVKKYNAVCTSKAIEIEDEVFNGCEIKAVASKMVLDLSYATIEKDVYINFKSNASSVLIVLPDGVNVTCDIEKVASKVVNEVENSDDNVNTVYIIGKANGSNVEVVPFSAFVEEEDDEEADFVDEDAEEEVSADVQVEEE